MKIKYLMILTLSGLLLFSPYGAAAQKDNGKDKHKDEQKTAENANSEKSETEKTETNDTWIKTKLVTAYTLNEHLNSFVIDVEVEKGMVTLSGEVENDIEKELAEEIARGVEGVWKVENNISVEPEARKRAEGKDRDFFEAVDDATTTARVKYRLLWNQHTDGLDIDVSTKEGVVTLAGLTASEIEKDLAVQIAENTKGVRKVVDNLKVSEKEAAAEKRSVLEKTGQLVSDAWITSKVKTTLLMSKDAEGASVNVNTEDAVVTLEGTVKSKKQEQQIIDLAENVVNVKSVRSNLSVEE